MRRVWLLAVTAPALIAGACGSGTTSVSDPLCAASPGPAPLRRLTRFEYGRTLNALTGIAPSAASALPPDEETLGFDDIAAAYSVSTLHAARYLEVAEQAAAALMADGARLQAVAGCDPAAGDAACVDSFIAAFGRRAWRRTLADDERQAMRELYTATADPYPADGLSAVVAAILQSPQFLYRPEPFDPAATPGAPLDGPTLATRLSFLLTGAGPDDVLLAAATDGLLAEDTGLLAETDRLLATGRAAELFVHFANQWWELGQLSSLDKDRSLYRTWTDDIPGALAEETRLFLTDAWQAGPTVATLLAAPFSYVDAALASFYGLPAPSGTGFVRVDLDPTRAAGLLTQGSFLAVHAKADQTSPVLRGKFVRQQLFCSPPPPPPPDIVVRPPTVDPRLSTRQRFAQHTAEQTCAACHAFMDPIGFGFEHYDAAGRWRDIDGGQPVDAAGMLTGTDVDGPIDGPPALADRLINSAQVKSCVATQWFRYAFGRAEQTEGDLCTIGKLASALEAPSGDFRQMVRSTVRMAAFRTLAPEVRP